MNGVANVFKLPGQTSRDAVDAVRRLSGCRKAGHAGTLDPGAAGVLPVLLGRATPLQEYLSGLEKVYVAEATFGMETDSSDAYGEVVELADSAAIDRADLEAAIPRFVGEINQIPPMTSALKRKGVPLYRLARRGIEVERQPRTVRVSDLNLLDWRGGDNPRALLEIRCSSGTYVRTLIADLARAAGSRAFMSFLVRTGVGPFGFRDAQIVGHAGEKLPEIIPPAEAVDFMPSVTLSDEQSMKVVHGNVPSGLDLPRDQVVRLLWRSGRLVALASKEPGATRTRLLRVFLRPEEIGEGS
ncbi:MAG: tRNA pseudouridine(55) synthase TruB [Bacillota bacterium]